MYGASMNLTDLKTFALVAETGTITGASKRLKIPKSTVSRRVRRLEDALGHELLRRSPRTVALTKHGKVLYERTRSALLEIDTAAETIAQADTEPSGTLRVTTTPSFGQSLSVVRCIKTYGEKYPKASVELELTNRLVNLVEEGVDIGIRLHPGPLPGTANLMSRRLRTFARALYASPSYVAKMGSPQTPDELKGHRLATHTLVDSGPVQWRYRANPWGTPRPLPEAKWRTNSTAMLERLALAGAAIAFIPTIEAEPHVLRGDLVRLLPDFDEKGAIVSLVWPSSRYLTPRVRSFINHAVETMGSAS